MNDDKYITIKEAAKKLGFTERTMSNWLKEGKLKAIKVGKRGLRISQQSIEDLINNHQFKVANNKIPETPVEKIEEPNVIFENASEDDTDMYK